MKLTVTARTGRIKSKVAKYRGLVGQEGDKFHDGSKVGNGERVPEDSNGYAHATVTFFLLSCPPSNVLSNIYLLFPYYHYYYSSSKYVPDFLSIFRIKNFWQTLVEKSFLRFNRSYSSSVILFRGNISNIQFDYLSSHEKIRRERSLSFTSSMDDETWKSSHFVFVRICDLSLRRSPADRREKGKKSNGGGKMPTLILLEPA